jgi:Mg2+/Co2+ transporter CorB
MNKKELLALKEEIVGKKNMAGLNKENDGKKTNRDEIIGKVLKELKEVLGWELSDEDKTSVVSFLNEEISKIDIREDEFEVGGLKRSRIVFSPLFDRIKKE